MIHKEPHALAGQKVTIASDVTDIGGQEFLIEDWWDRIAGKSWMWCDGNPACLSYAMRTGTQDRHVPNDNEVVYGKVGAFGHLVHVSELQENDE